jgi:lysophospholipase L1-like esterase
MSRSNGSDPKRILAYGDWLTWGWIPVHVAPPSRRYPPEGRWPGVMQEALGTGYEVIEAGLNGRTADLPDPTLPQISGSGLDGSADLPATLATHLPLDLVLIMLGTNDLKAMFDRSPFRIALGCAQPDSRSQSRNNLVSQCRESWTDQSAGYFLSRTEW